MSTHRRWIFGGLVAVAACADGRDGGDPSDSDSDTDVAVACDGDGSRDIACGLNDNGTQAQDCVDGVWEDDGACDDPDVCVEDDTRDEACGINGRGTQAQVCLGGQWADDGGCVDVDECVDEEPIPDACDTVCEEGTLTVRGQRWTSVSVGGGHTCATDTTGAVWCWGGDGSGQLGNGLPLAASATPVQVTGIDDAVRVVAGNVHTCALRAGGTVSCWGSDGSGQLGDDASLVDQPEPVAVSGLTGVVTLDLGATHACAILGNGKMSCWGSDGLGELGNGAPSGTQAVPTEVAGFTGGVEVSTGTQHTCATQVGNRTWCWGSDAFGQIGNDAAFDNDQISPFQLNLTAGVGHRLLTAGALHQCVDDDANGVTCWGDNSVGQGNGSPGGTNISPVDVNTVGPVRDLDAGGLHTCAVLVDGTVVCWGHDDDGQLGNGAAGGGAVSAVVGLTDVVEVSAGDVHTCARTVDGTIWCWGDDGAGQLGRGAAGADAQEPVRVTAQGPSVSCGVVQVDAGFGPSPTVCAVLADGTVSCWGDAAGGKLGDTTETDRDAAIEVNGSADVLQVSVGERHACALLADFSVACWGDGRYRGSGFGVASTWNVGNDPSPAYFGYNPIDVSAGPTHTCVANADGVAFCFGDDDQGQLGNGATTTNNQVDPRQVTGLADVVGVEVGRGFSCALLAGGAVSCWGDDALGQLGYGASAMDATSPVSVTGVSRTVDLAVGDAHACALHADGTVRCWGSDERGQRGDGAGVHTATDTATVVVGLDDVVSIDAGGDTTCARRGSGEVVCWGSDADGARGDGPGTTPDQDAPTTLLTSSDVRSVTVGGGVGCALRASGRPECWGSDAEGQLGNGAATGVAESPVPTVWP